MLRITVENCIIRYCQINLCPPPIRISCLVSFFIVLFLFVSECRFGVDIIVMTDNTKSFGMCLLSVTYVYYPYHVWNTTRANFFYCFLFSQVFFVFLVSPSHLVSYELDALDTVLLLVYSTQDRLIFNELAIKIKSKSMGFKNLHHFFNFP